MADQIPLLLQALDVSPDNWPTRRYLIGHFASLGEVDRAAELVKQAPSIPADEAEQLFAAEILAKSDPPAAQILLDDILSANAACAQAHVVKAAIHRLAGDEAKAASHIKVAGVLAPDLDVESAIAAAVARPEAPPADLPLEVSQAVQIVTSMVEARAETGDTGDDGGLAVVVEADTEEPAAEPAVEIPPATLSAVPLRPPGERDSVPAQQIAPVAEAHYEGSSILPPAQPSFAATGYVDVDAEAHEYYEGEPHEGERAFIVGEGELVHAHEKDPDSREKLSAITVAIAVHVVLIVLFGYFIISAPPKDPPLITAAHVVGPDDNDLPTERVVKKQQTSAAIQQATPVVTVSSYSDVAVPEITDDLSDMSLVTLGDSNGTIGMSMTGLGDVSNMGAIPATMRSRCSLSQRMKRLRESGGEERAEGAVRKALEYLASRQDKATGAIGTEYPAAMTGLSLLAFLGHCETPESPKFGNAVIGAAQYLMEQGKKNDGWIFNGDRSGNHSAYEHGIATYALAELFTMTKESGREIPQLDSVLRKAVKIIVDGQTGDGGWLYGYKGSSDGDYSVSGWQIQALKAAYNTGKGYPGVERALDKAIQYTFDAQDDSGAIKYRLGDPKGKPTLTGAGVLALQMWDQGDSSAARLGLDYLDIAYPNPSPGNNFYAPYYTTQAYFLEGGARWEKYNSVFQNRLLDAQNADGSWLQVAGGQGHGPKQDNPIYATALGALMLEVYYRYLPTTEKVQGLKAP